MSAPPNPNQLARRTLGLIRQAAQGKDDETLGARVREILTEHDEARQAMQAEIEQFDAAARARKAGENPAKATP